MLVGVPLEMFGDASDICCHVHDKTATERQRMLCTSPQSFRASLKVACEVLIDGPAGAMYSGNIAGPTTLSGVKKTMTLFLRPYELHLPS